MPPACLWCLLPRLGPHRSVPLPHAYHHIAQVLYYPHSLPFLKFFFFFFLSSKIPSSLFLLAEVPFLPRAAQTQACLRSLSRSLAVSMDALCGLCSLEQQAAVCLSFSVNTHRHPDTHRDTHIRTHRGTTHTQKQIHTPNLSTLRAGIVYYFSTHRKCPGQ